MHDRLEIACGENDSLSFRANDGRSDANDFTNLLWSKTVTSNAKPQ